jgi:hypothetical protein
MRLRIGQTIAEQSKKHLDFLTIFQFVGLASLQILLEIRAGVPDTGNNCINNCVFLYKEIIEIYLRVN